MMLRVIQNAQMQVFPSQNTQKIKGFMKENPQGIFFKNDYFIYKHIKISLIFAQLKSWKNHA